MVGLLMNYLISLDIDYIVWAAARSETQRSLAIVQQLFVYIVARRRQPFTFLDLRVFKPVQEEKKFPRNYPQHSSAIPLK